jgi:HK97 family phage major capsid protein
MMSKLFPSSLDNAVWVMSPSAWTQIMQLAMPVGVGGSAVMVANVVGQTAAQKPQRFLMGVPYVVSEKMAALGTSKDLALLDLSYYLVGDRMQMSITTSTDRYFETDQTAFRIIERLDGQSWINQYLLANNGTDTLSAFVYLTDAS